MCPSSQRAEPEVSSDSDLQLLEPHTAVTNLQNIQQTTNESGESQGQLTEMGDSSSHFRKSYIQGELQVVADVTAFSPPDTINAAHAHLDAEVEAARHAIRIFHARRNAVAIVSRLPNDVLLQIFTFLVDADPPKMQAANRHLPVHRRLRCLGWIIVTHICRSWREVALANATLWSRIERHLNWAWWREMSSRCRSHPLRVDLATETTNSKVINAVLEPVSLKRVSQLHLQLGHPRIDRHSLDKLAAPAPLLHSFSLHVLYEDNMNTLPVPEIITVEHYPRLHRLILKNSFQSPCSAQVLHNLTYLEIKGNWPYAAGPTPEQLIDIIQESHLLQTLLLERCRPQDASYETAKLEKFLQHRRFPLEHLRRLEIQGECCAVPLLLSQIEIPTSATVCLRLEDYKYSMAPSSLFIPRLLPWGALIHGHQADTHFESLSLSVRGIVGIQMKGKNYPTLRLVFTSNLKPLGLDRVSDFLRASYTLGYYKRISSLAIDSRDAIAGGETERLLASPGMSGVKELHLNLRTSGVPNDDRNTLHLFKSLSSEDGEGVLRLPALRHLVLDPQRRLFGPTAWFEGALLAFLAVRQSRGTPLFYFTAFSRDGAEAILRKQVQEFLGHPDPNDISEDESDYRCFFDASWPRTGWTGQYGVKM